MFSNSPFWRTTWRLDALLIWSGATSIVTWLFALFEGWGMALSILIAMGVLPLAMLSFIIFQHRAALASLVRSFSAATATGEDAALAAADGASGFRNEIEGQAHERLQLFIIDHLNDACWSQIELQRALLRMLCSHEKVLFFADQGLDHDYMHPTFCENASVVFDLGGSPLPTMTNGQMIDCITALENEAYRNFCAQADELAQSAGIDFRRHPVTGPLWDAWREHHNALVTEYDKLKRESRFPAPLYRPQRDSRWGGVVPSLEAAKSQ